MKKNFRYGFLLILIMAMTILAACGGNEEEPVNPDEEEVPNEVVEQTDDGETNEEEDSANEGEPNEQAEPNGSADQTSDDANANEDGDKQTITGTFTGLADLHTFEVTTDEVEDGFVAFQFYDEELSAALENMEVGQEVTVTYTKNEHGQHLAEKVE